MAFENRRGNSYYYRKQRTGKRVRSIYVGSDLNAFLTSHLAFKKYYEAVVERNEQHEQRRELAALDALLDSVAEKTNDLVTATLLINNFHQHKRQWRRKRKRK